jgi:hypothetical protein
MTSIRTILLFVGLLWTAAAQSAPVHHYTVSINPQLRTLSVRACFDGAPLPALVAPSPHARYFVKAASDEDDPKRLSLAALPRDSCMNYRVDVGAIADLRQLTLGSWIGADMIVAPEVWLWRPADHKGDIEIHFELPMGIAVSAPWRRLPNGDYRVGHTPAHWPALVAFGRFEERKVKVPGAMLRLAVLDGNPPANVDAVQTWVEDAARAVVGLYGRFPVDRAQVLVIPQGRGGRPVTSGQVLRGGAGAVQLFINQRRPLKDFLADWIPTHEFTHLTLPLLRRGGAWLSEGIATYYQNVLRARDGRLSAQQAWQALYKGFIKRGKKASRDTTLLDASANIYRDRAYTHVYWSGAAIALLADMQLRKQSGNKQSLDSALEKFDRCCQPWNRAWSAHEVLERLDNLAGTELFTALYRQHVTSTAFPDLTATYAELGLKTHGDEIELRPAPYTHLRDAIMRGGQR